MKKKVKNKRTAVDIPTSQGISAPEAQDIDRISTQEITTPIGSGKTTERSTTESAEWIVQEAIRGAMVLLEEWVPHRFASASEISRYAQESTKYRNSRLARVCLATFAVAIADQITGRNPRLVGVDLTIDFSHPAIISLLQDWYQAGRDWQRRKSESQMETQTSLTPMIL